MDPRTQTPTADAVAGGTTARPGGSEATALAWGSTLRVVNFHNMPPTRADAYERQFAAWAGRFSACSDHDVIEFIRSGVWSKPAPGLVPVFFEGYRNTYDVGLPLAERFGFTAWFMVPTAFPAVPVQEQRTFAAAHHLGLVDGEQGRVAMTWDEIGDAAARGHVIASHTRHHAPLTLETPLATLRDEILGSQEELECHLGQRSSTFVWLFGSAYGVDPRADRLVREAGYRLVFSNHKLQLVGDGAGPDGG